MCNMCPPFLLLLLALYAGHDGLEYPCGQMGSVVPAVSRFNFLYIPSPLTGGVRARKGFGSVQALLKTSL